MKIKLLLATLAGFSLVACNQDDFVEQQQLPEAQPSYTFTVQWDEDMTRAGWGGKTDGTVKFEEGDLFSMFHKAGEFNIMTDPGTPPIGDPGDSDYNPGTPPVYSTDYFDLGEYDNAIFTGEGFGDDFTLVNRSAMIRPGAAFMVYPADTTFNRDGLQETIISIKQNQPKDYSVTLPHVTDLMEIGPRDEMSEEKPHNTAGYNRNYDIKFKQLGTLYRLKLKYDNISNFPADVKAVTIDKVELKNGVSGDLFNLDARLVALGTTSTLNGYTDSKGITYTHFKKQIDVDFEGIVPVNSISTKDIKPVNNELIAYFVIMPHDKDADYGSLVSDDASIVITTNYGQITIDNDTDANGEKPIKRNEIKDPDATNEWSIKDGFADLLKNTWGVKSAGSAFTGANVGRDGQRTLEFDLSDIVFEGLVAKNSKELTDILAVYEAFGSTDPITIELDAEELDGGFILNKAAMDKLATIGKGKVTLDEDANNNFIVLQGASDDMFTSFNAKVNSVDAVKFSGGTVNVELRGSSTLDQAVDFRKVAELRNAGALTVTNKVPMAESNPFGKTLKLVDASLSETTPVTSLTIASKVYMGEVNTPDVVAGKAGVDIFVKAGGTYYAAAGSDFYARTTIEDGGSLIAYGGTVRNFGTLVNYGRLGSDAGSGKFNNGGTIINKFSKTSTNYTYLNANTLNSPTYTGIVYLNDRDDEFQVQLTGRKGYIVYTAHANSATTPLEVGIEANDKFNYLVVKSTAKDAKVDISGLFIEDENKYAINWLRIEEMSAELISTKGNSTTAKLDALFVRNESLIYKSSNAVLNITNLWIETDLTAPTTKLKYDSMNGTYNSGTYGVQDKTFSGKFTSNN